MIVIPPGSLTWPLKTYHPKRKVVFQPSFFRGYVKLRGCISSNFQIHNVPKICKSEKPASHFVEVFGSDLKICRLMQPSFRSLATSPTSFTAIYQNHQKDWLIKKGNRTTRNFQRYCVNISYPYHLPLPCDIYVIRTNIRTGFPDSQPVVEALLMLVVLGHVCSQNEVDDSPANVVLQIHCL